MPVNTTCCANRSQGDTPFPTISISLDERTTDHEGRFWIPYFPGTTLDCSAGRDGFERAGLKGSADEIFAGGSGELRIVLREAAPAKKAEKEPKPLRYPLEVRCLTTDGRPVKGMEVTVFARLGRNTSFDRGVGGPLDYTRGMTGSDGHDPGRPGRGGAPRLSEGAGAGGIACHQ